MLDRHMDLRGVDAQAMLMRKFGTHRSDSPVLLDMACREAAGYEFGYVMWPRKWAKGDLVDFYVAFTADGFEVEDVTEVGVWLAETIREEHDYGLTVEDGGRIVPIAVPPDRANPTGRAELLIEPEFHWTSTQNWGHG